MQRLVELGLGDLALVPEGLAPAAEKTHLIAALGGVNVGVDEANPGKTFEKAFDAARGALAYQG